MLRWIAREHIPTIPHWSINLDRGRMYYQRADTIGGPCNTFQTPVVRDILKRKSRSISRTAFIR
jgi:hypothetical protein